MNHNDFFKLIAADGLRGAYLLQGEEEFVKASALKAAEKLIPEDFRAFNMSVLYEPDADALTEACETQSKRIKLPRVCTQSRPEKSCWTSLNRLL